MTADDDNTINRSSTSAHPLSANISSIYLINIPNSIT